MTQEYNVGAGVRLFGEFRNYARELDDPSTVVFKLRSPAPSVTTYTYGVDAEVVRQGPGHYYVDVQFDQAGKWYYRFEGSGDVTAADEECITVERTVF